MKKFKLKFSFPNVPYALSLCIVLNSFIKESFNSYFFYSYKNYLNAMSKLRLN